MKTGDVSKIQKRQYISRLIEETSGDKSVALSDGAAVLKALNLVSGLESPIKERVFVKILVEDLLQLGHQSPKYAVNG